MQTFLPFPDFARSAKALDYRRLGKQRVECLQLLKALELPNYGWRHHPAAKMWQGFEGALREYKDACIREWIARGYKNTMEYSPTPNEVILPSWIGNVDFHRSHQSNLLRKDPVFYGPLFPGIPDNLPYIWPTP